MNTHKPSFLRYAATFVFSYLLSLFLLLLISCLILLRTVFSPIYMMNRVDSSGFTALALAEIQEIYVSHAAASGVPGDVLLSVLTYRHVDDAVKAEMCAAYKTSRPYDFDRYEDEIYNALHDYAIGRGFEPTAELEIGLRDLAELCVTDFEAHLISPAIDFLGRSALEYSEYLYIGIAAVSVLAVMTAALLPMMNRRMASWLSGYMYALVATVIICAAVPAAVFSSGFTQQLNITPLSYNRLLASWIEGLAEGYLVALIPLLLLLAVCVTLWVPRRK